MDFSLGSSDVFSLVNTFECGQCFRWNACGEGYVGITGDKIAKIYEKNGEVRINSNCGSDAFWREYFDCDRNYDEIKSFLPKDSFTTAAIEFGRGMRILRQEPWEALCSFLISQCNNIPRIKSIIECLCRMYGEKRSIDGAELYSFPTYEKVAGLSENDLVPLRAGYRVPYIINAAKAVAAGTVDFDSLRKMPLAQARKAIMRLDGVGPKVADCFLLFGLSKTDAFPVDTWMKKANKYYDGKLSAEQFGQYAGFAQQYIFYYIRSFLGKTA